MNEKISVIGLGYVGLPVAIGFAQSYSGTVGFDINIDRIAELKNGKDHTLEVSPEKLKSSTIKFTTDPEDMHGSTIFVITVPTPTDMSKQPDLTPLRKASETVGKVLGKGAIVVYESTVYPGVTREFCRPILANVSGLKPGDDFTVAYSPERINPGDKEHTLETITKVVSAEDEQSLARVARAYSRIVTAGIHKAPNIETAEAAKVIENSQRDINIAFMNELALIFDRMGIRTIDVIEAASTKWNFLKFAPGLVGGHCIGVDPYYLTAKAELLGYHPEVILAGRRINDNMGNYVAQKLIKLLIYIGASVRDAKVAVLGLTFKENVPDLRNSRVPDIITELNEFGVFPKVHDPQASVADAKKEYGVDLCKFDEIGNLDALILAVPHKEYCSNVNDLLKLVKPGGIVMDVKSALDPKMVKETHVYWSL
ncbi:nucleotide sugar dehydrogenase [bacterium]|nr:nucleotide sugar dehydrogenase [bacterium]